MTVRLAHGLYASPRRRPARPKGGLHLLRLVREAEQACRFHRLFKHNADVVELVRTTAQRQGWTLQRAEIVEAVEELT